MVAPLFAAVVVAGFIGGVVQVGLHFTAEPLTPNWDRINPVNGLKRLFSLDALTEALKAVIKMTVVFLVAWFFLKGRAMSVGHYFNRGVPELSVILLWDLARLFFIIVASLGCFAALDYLYQRYRLEK